MVRKRNKSPIDNKDPASHRLVERLANILELSGVWRDSEDDDDDPWESLASSLEKIATHMKKLESEEIFDLKLDDLLLGFEQTAQDVRAQGDILLDCIRENRIELDLFQEIESFCDLQEFSRLRPLFRSLLSAMKYQRFLARDVIQNALLKITHLYSDDNSDGPNTKDFIADIRNDALLIRTRCLDAKNSPWKEAEAFIKELERNQSTKVESLIEAINSSCAGAESICDNVSVATDEAKGSPTNPHPNLLSSESIAEAVLKFSSHHASSSHKSFSILLVGPEGSGKTHNCDLIEKIVPPDVHVVRPSLPFDTMGLSVGDAEDILISMVSFARTISKRSILVLDNVENVCGYEYNGPSKLVGDNGVKHASGGEPHVTARVRSVLLSLLEIFRQGGEDDSEMLFIVTSTANLGQIVDRFDKIFTLEPPSAKERRAVVSQYIVSMTEDTEVTLWSFGRRIEELLSRLIDCTSGLSYSELDAYCRQAALTNKENNDSGNQENNTLEFLEALKGQLQSSMPESLRNGANADFVDMKVMSARDLCGTSRDSATKDPIDFPLFGFSAESAWEELRRLIVMPICRAKALDKLMFHRGGSGGKVFAGGVLVTGPPGCGKSALAYHCAAIAASINPSVKFIDVSCTSLIHKEVGSSERSIHRLFKSARSAAPCIMLMDGIENIAAVRGNDNTTEGTMDRVLSTLLTELDGVDSEHVSQDPACLAIIGITHNSKWVDPALRRPGRLERIIEIGLPEHEARRKLVLKDLEGIPYKAEHYEDKLPTLEKLAEHVASETEGFTGAGVIAICNEAKMISSKNYSEGPCSDSIHLAPQHMMDAIKVRKRKV